MCEQVVETKDLEEIEVAWKVRGKELGGSDKKVSYLISKLLKLIKMSHKMRADSITSVLTTVFYAIDAGPEVIDYMSDLLDDEFWDVTPEIEEGMLNLYNEDGTQVAIGDLKAISLPDQMSFQF